jgi:hypothetical protein
MKSLLRPITVWLQASASGHNKRLAAKFSTAIIKKRLMFFSSILIHQNPNKISSILHKFKVNIKKSPLTISI